MKTHVITQNEEFHYYPTNQVVGVIDGPWDVASAWTDLVGSGFTSDDIEVKAGSEGLHQLDASGNRHGFAGRLMRMLQGYGDIEQVALKRQVDELRAGHTLVGVLARDAGRRQQAEQILKRYHGHYINYFGQWIIVGMDA